MVQTVYFHRERERERHCYILLDTPETCWLVRFQLLAWLHKKLSRKANRWALVTFVLNKLNP